MTNVRTFHWGPVLAAMSLFAFASTTFAEHLDWHETRRVARHIDELNDQLQDRIDDWVAERPEERGPRAESFARHFDRFDAALCEYRAHLLDHQEPWELRDEVAQLLDTEASAAKHLFAAHFLPPGIQDQWREVHRSVRELAHRYHLEDHFVEIEVP